MDAEELVKDLWPRTKKTLPEFSFWRKGSEPYTATILYNQTETTEFKSLIIDVDRSYVEVFKEKFRDVTVMMKFKFSVDVQYFSSGNIDWNPSVNKFVIHLGQPFFVTTKRSSCRYVSSNADRIQLKLAGQTFTCYDISSGGFSTLIKNEEVGGIEKGQVFEKAELKYNLKRFIIPKVRLVNIIPMDKSEWTRYAFKFEGLKVVEEDALWVEVNNSVRNLAHLVGNNN